MDNYFDDESKVLITNAKKEMFELKHPYVGSEHLFLAILRYEDLDITKKLNYYGITYDSFKEHLIGSVGIGKKTSDWYIFTPLLKKIISNAIYYSSESNNCISPKGLLLSLLNVGDGVANRILLSSNIDVCALYEKLI